MPCHRHIFASIPRSLISTDMRSLSCTFLVSRNVAILLTPIPHVGLGSTAGSAGMLELGGHIYKTPEPSTFLLCSVEMGTLKMAPFHIYYITAVTICLAHFFGGGTICAMCQSFAKRQACTHCMRSAMSRSLLYASPAWVRIMVVIVVNRISLTVLWSSYAKTQYLYLVTVWYVQHLPRGVSCAYR